MQPISIEALVEATLIGARRHGHDAGQTYRRRQLTSKQRSLLVLLADGDAIGAEELAAAFSEEWANILAAHPEREPGQQRQALFENLAQVATRINAYLLAGYKDCLLRARMLPLLGGQFLAIATNFADHEMWILPAESHEGLQQLAALAGPTRRRKPAQAKAEAAAPEVELALPQPRQEPNKPVPAADASSSTAKRDPQAADTQIPEPEEPAPPPPGQLPTTVGPAAPEVISAEVNPVTQRWTLHLPEGEIEADFRLATVRVGSILRRWAGDPLPEDPEALTPSQVTLLRDMLNQFVSS